MSRAGGHSGGSPAAGGGGGSGKVSHLLITEEIVELLEAHQVGRERDVVEALQNAVDIVSRAIILDVCRHKKETLANKQRLSVAAEDVDKAMPWLAERKDVPAREFYKYVSTCTEKLGIEKEEELRLRAHIIATKNKRRKLGEHTDKVGAIGVAPLANDYRPGPPIVQANDQPLAPMYPYGTSYPGTRSSSYINGPISHQGRIKNERQTGPKGSKHQPSLKHPHLQQQQQQQQQQRQHQQDHFPPHGQVQAQTGTSRKGPKRSLRSAFVDAGGKSVVRTAFRK
mmetsp:Transcript_17682/g.32565  ORF Transcript_17682/g.32565 Transcript_17682/m.32565 type:complete len:283 (+) Transcript_17682:68-916(+)